MTPRRSLAPPAGALLARLSFLALPAGAGWAAERPDASEAKGTGGIGVFRLGLGRFKWNQTHRIVTAPRRVGASLRCEGDRQTYRVNCRRRRGPRSRPPDDQLLPAGGITWTCSGIPRPSVDRLYPGWFDFSGSLYTKGSELEPGVHTETLRDDGTVAGVHILEGIEGGGDNGSSARVEWSLRPAE